MLKSDDLFAAFHTNELEMRKETILNLDLTQRGIGTLSAGPDTLDKYKISAGVHKFNYRLQFFDPNKQLNTKLKG